MTISESSACSHLPPPPRAARSAFRRPPASSAVWPLASANLSATLPWSVHNPVNTGPGLTELTRMFFGANSFDSAFGKIGDGSFGGAVLTDRGVGEVGVDRADDDDRAAAAPLHLRQRRAGGPHHAHHVQIPGRLPLAVGDAGEPARAYHGGTEVVDQNVDPATGGALCGHFGGDLVGDVDSRVLRVDAASVDVDYDVVFRDERPSTRFPARGRRVLQSRDGT